jgi:hypothetical protein
MLLSSGSPRWLRLACRRLAWRGRACPASFLRSGFSAAELAHVQFVSLEVDNLSNLAHNELMCTHWLWRQAAAERVLIFQTDSLLCRAGIEAFQMWDYVGGAPAAARRHHDPYTCRHPSARSLSQPLPAVALLAMDPHARNSTGRTRGHRGRRAAHEHALWCLPVADTLTRTVRRHARSAVADRRLVVRG